jgi:hypothetical protein
VGDQVIGTLLYPVSLAFSYYIRGKKTFTDIVEEA